MQISNYIEEFIWIFSRKIETVACPKTFLHSGYFWGSVNAFCVTQGFACFMRLQLTAGIDSHEHIQVSKGPAPFCR
jgi:hypothetical protein